MLKRDMIICIRKSGTADDPIVLPIVDEAIDIATKEHSTSALNVTTVRPKLSNQEVNRGIQESTLKFTTYIKPYLDTGISLVDDLLYRSLLSYNVSDTMLAQQFGTSIFGIGLAGTAMPGQIYNMPSTEVYFESLNSFSMAKFDLFVIYKDTGTTFSLTNAVTVSADFQFDITGISRVKWTVSGINYAQDTTPNYIYPNNIDTYLINKWTQATLDFPFLNSNYSLAATNFTLSIKNTVKFPYTEKMNQRFATADDEPVLLKRNISAKFSMYLKVISLSVFDDIISTIETYSYLDDPATFIAKIGSCDTDILSIELSNVNIKYPKTKLDDVATLDLNMNGETAIFIYT